MARRQRISAGLLLFRRRETGIEVFLAHPGGPFWARRDAGAWTIPKGLVDADEHPLIAARREFEEETGIRPEGEFLPLGSIRQKAGKQVQAWAWEGDADADQTRSNTIRIEWPRGSGRWMDVPEVDRCAWFDFATARTKMNPAQIELLDRLEGLLSGSQADAAAAEASEDDTSASGSESAGPDISPSRDRSRARGSGPTGERPRR